MNFPRWIALVVLMVFASLVRAAEPTTTTATPAPSTPFARGTWALSLSGSYVDNIRFSEDYFYNFNLTAGYYFWNNTSFNLDLQGSWVNQPGDEDDALLGAIGLFGRTHFLVHDPWSLFVDGGGMVSYSDNTVPITPYHGTHFNFIGKIGGGASFHLTDNTFLLTGVRYFHLSNGQIHGRDQNPSFDGIEFWGGVMWTW